MTYITPHHTRAGEVAALARRR